MHGRAVWHCVISNGGAVVEKLERENLFRYVWARRKVIFGDLSSEIWYNICPTLDNHTHLEPLDGETPYRDSNFKMRSEHP